MLISPVSPMGYANHGHSTGKVGSEYHFESKRPIFCGFLGPNDPVSPRRRQIGPIFGYVNISISFRERVLQNIPPVIRP